MPVVYIDVLLGVNLFVNYFLLLAVGRFLHLAVRRLRLLAGAAVGAAFSLSILLPPLPAVLPTSRKKSLQLAVVLVAPETSNIFYFHETLSRRKYSHREQLKITRFDPIFI